VKPIRGEAEAPKTGDSLGRAAPHRGDCGGSFSRAHPVSTWKRRWQGLMATGKWHPDIPSDPATSWKDDGTAPDWGLPAPRRGATTRGTRFPGVALIACPRQFPWLLRSQPCPVGISCPTGNRDEARFHVETAVARADGNGPRAPRRQGFRRRLVGLWRDKSAPPAMEIVGSNVRTWEGSSTGFT
jgi:hypothetical protein